MTLKGTLSDKALSLREIEILRLSPRTEVFLYDGVAFYFLWVAASSALCDSHRNMGTQNFR